MHFASFFNLESLLPPPFYFLILFLSFSFSLSWLLDSRDGLWCLHTRHMQPFTQSPGEPLRVPGHRRDLQAVSSRSSPYNTQECLFLLLFIFFICFVLAVSAPGLGAPCGPSPPWFILSPAFPDSFFQRLTGTQLSWFLSPACPWHFSGSIKPLPELNEAWPLQKSHLLSGRWRVNLCNWQEEASRAGGRPVECDQQFVSSQC